MQGDGHVDGHQDRWMCGGRGSHNVTPASHQRGSEVSFGPQQKRRCARARAHASTCALVPAEVSGVGAGCCRQRGVPNTCTRWSLRATLRHNKNLAVPV